MCRLFDVFAANIFSVCIKKKFIIKYLICSTDASLAFSIWYKGSKLELLFGQLLRILSHSLASNFIASVAFRVVCTHMLSKILQTPFTILLQSDLSWANLVASWNSTPLLSKSLDTHLIHVCFWASLGFFLWFIEFVETFMAGYLRIWPKKVKSLWAIWCLVYHAGVFCGIYPQHFIEFLLVSRFCCCRRRHWRHMRYSFLAWCLDWVFCLW